MSTYIYLECIAHDPPIQAVSESGQHLSDLDRLRGELQLRDEYATAIAIDARFDDPYTQATAKFLSEHPECPLRIIDEYGTHHNVVKDKEEDDE